MDRPPGPSRRFGPVGRGGSARSRARECRRARGSAGLYTRVARDASLATKVGFRGTDRGFAERCGTGGTKNLSSNQYVSSMCFASLGGDADTPDNCPVDINFINMLSAIPKLL